MSKTEHTPRCIDANDGIFVFTPGCPLCQAQKAAPQLLEACKAANQALTRIKALNVVPWTHTDVSWGIHELEAALAVAGVKE